MNRRNLLIGLGLLIVGSTLACGVTDQEREEGKALPRKINKGPIKRNAKLKAVKGDYSIIFNDSEDIEDILDTVPLEIKRLLVGNRTVDIDDLVIYPVKKGDSLSKIAERFYGSQGSWREVYELNEKVRGLIRQFNPEYLGHLIGNNPNKIKKGQLIFLEKAVEDLTLPKDGRI